MDGKNNMDANQFFNNFFIVSASISLLSITYHLCTLLSDTSQLVKDANLGMNTTFVNVNGVVGPVARNMNEGSSLLSAIRQKN